MKMRTFVSEHKIKIDSVLVADNPNMESDRRMNHYKVVLRGRFDDKRKQLTTYFSMGLGLSGDPRAEDVLDCMASDSASIKNARSFEGWADEFGYEHDSRPAERTYKVCQKQAARLQKFLGGHKYYNVLLWKVERL